MPLVCSCPQDEGIGECYCISLILETANRNWDFKFIKNAPTVPCNQNYHGPYPFSGEKNTCLIKFGELIECQGMTIFAVLVGEYIVQRGVSILTHNLHFGSSKKSVLCYFV
jgi:hypothetical protein